MIQSIESRELFTLRAGKFLVHGTYHKPAADVGSAAQRIPVGLLFWNSLSLPRSAKGDSAAFWADAFAQHGYPSFRIDLPGLGDSPGELPVNLLNFINAGGFAESASRAMRELVARFSLSGMVVVGHCAGGVTAIYSAAQCEECKGLVLMDQYFHLPQAIRPKARRLMSDWALHTRMGRLASNAYDRIRGFSLFLKGNRLPGNANLALLRSWKDVASSGTPILLLKAPARKATGINPRTGEFDYLSYAMKVAGLRGRVAVRLIEGTEHSFSNRYSRDGVRLEVANWLETNFPQVEARRLDSEGKPSTMPFDQSPARCAVIQ